MIAKHFACFVWHQWFNKFSYSEYHVSVLCCVNIHFLVCLESSESFTNVLRAYQSLEPGDFTGFLKLLRSPSSQLLQSRCTTFLKTMEDHHVIICWKRWAIVITSLSRQSCSDHRCTSSVQDLPVQKQSDYVQDFYQSFAEYFSSECTCIHNTSHAGYSGDLTVLNNSWLFPRQVFLRLRSLS